MAESDADSDLTVDLVVDGVPVKARPGEMVIAATDRAGVHIPRFCYHSRMKPVGMCRMCIVEIDTGRGPALQPSCMIPVADNMVVDTRSEMTRRVQDGVLELLLINHPLDCPVCDKGGECPLQDNTVAFGPGESRFVEEKRHYEKPIPISDLVYLDRERCILCDRCTRFAKEVAGDPLIHFVNRGNATEVNTFPDEPFSSYFSGNTVQICPVGALTAKPYRFKARPWDLESVESTCQGCAVGCSITVQASRNEVLRYQGVDNDASNWGWLCDRGRFSFEAITSEARLVEPMVRRDGALTPARWTDALAAAAAALRAARSKDPSRIGLVGGARESNEDAYAWAKLVKSVLGSDNADAQQGDGLPPEVVLGLPRATLSEACAPKSTIVLLGPDPKETLPVLYLRLRHAVAEDGAALVEIGHAAGGLSSHAAVSLLGLPGELDHLVERFLASPDAALVAADRAVTVVLGRTSPSERPDEVARAVSRLAAAVPQLRVLPALTDGNVFGALDAGLSPGLLAGPTPLDASTSWGSVPTTPGLDSAAMLRAAAAGRLDVLILLGADPLGRFPDRRLVEQALAAVPTVIVADRFHGELAADHGDVVLPLSGPAEHDGTTTNFEGRVLPLRRIVTAPGVARPAWSVAVELALELDADLGFSTLDELWADYASFAPERAAARAVVTAGEAPDGVVAVGSPIDGDAAEPATPPPLAPADLRLVVRSKLYDGDAVTVHSPSLAGLVAPSVVTLHPSDFAELGVVEGTMVTVSSDHGSLRAAVSADAGAVPRSATILANVPGAEANRLGSADDAWVAVRIDTRAG